MYIWTAKVEEHWSYEDKEEYSDVRGDISIVAKDHIEALSKLKKYLLSMKFVDDEKVGVVDKLTSFRLLKLERGSEIDVA